MSDESPRLHVERASRAAIDRPGVLGLLRALGAYVRSPAGVYLMAAVLRRASALVLIPIYARRLTLAEYGDYGLALTAVTVGAGVFGLGLNSSVSKTYFDERVTRDAEERTGSLMKSIVLVVAGWTVLGCATTLFLPHGGIGMMRRRVLVLLLVATAGAAMNPLMLVYLRTIRRAIFAAALQIVDFVTSSVFGVLFVLALGRGFEGAIEALAASGAISGAIAVAYIFLRLPGRPRLGPLLKALPFASPFLLHFFATWMLGASDRWFLKFFGFNAGVGAYVIAAQLSSPALMPASSLSDAEFARVGEIYRDHGLRGVGGDLPHARKVYALAALLPALGIIAALPVLAPVLGARAHTALPLVPVLSLLAVVDAEFFPHQLVLYYAARLRALSMVTLLTALTSIVTMSLFVPLLGVVGALVARALTSLARTGTIALLASRAARDNPAPFAAPG